LINTKEKSEPQSIIHKVLNNNEILEEYCIEEEEMINSIENEIDEIFSNFKTSGSSQNLESENEHLKHQLSQLKEANTKWKSMNNDMLNNLLNY